MNKLGPHPTTWSPSKSTGQKWMWGESLQSTLSGEKFWSSLRFYSVFKLTDIFFFDFYFLIHFSKQRRGSRNRRTWWRHFWSGWSHAHTHTHTHTHEQPDGRTQTDGQERRFIVKKRLVHNSTYAVSVVLPSIVESGWGDPPPALAARAPRYCCHHWSPQCGWDPCCLKIWRAWNGSPRPRILPFVIVFVCDKVGFQLGWLHTKLEVLVTGTRDTTHTHSQITASCMCVCAYNYVCTHMCVCMCVCVDV